ncbi:MAG: B12-binding domain-containing radical SAM protein [Nitrospinota bacterium]|nr:B12-binding domain-containing radical SAM protein [Nitrospinota bacterium]
MKVVVATSPGRFSGNRYPCPFPSRWTSLFQDYPVFIFFPYELAYLSSLLKRDLPNANVKMVDGTWLRFTTEDYLRYLEYEKPDYVVFEADTVTYGETLKVAKAIKAKLGTKIIMTGQYPTVYPQKVLEDGNDYACIGEYEETVKDILLGLEPSSIQGLYPNPHRHILNIDSLPDPEDDDIRRIDYSYSGGCRWTRYRSIEVHATRGCPYTCDFCVAGNVYYEKPNWRARSPERIIGEIETLRSKYPGIEGVFFNEETHIVKKDWILKLCDAIVASGNNDLHYEAMANHLLLNEEILVALKKAGYYRLRIGIETIDDTTSRSIGRKTKPERLENLLRLAKKIGIEMYGTFIIGASGSSKEGDLATIDYGANLLSEGLISSHQESIAVPHPGTPFYTKAVKEGWLKSDDHENFNGVLGSVISYPHYSGDEIKESLQTLAKRFEIAKGQETVREVKSIQMQKTALLTKDRQAVKEELKKLEDIFNCGEHERTIEEAEKILERFPQLLKPLYLAASARKRLGMGDESLEIFERIIATSLDYDDALSFAGGAHYHIADIYLSKGMKEEAMEHVKKCMHLVPLHEKAREVFWKLSQDGIGPRKMNLQAAVQFE